MGGINSKRKFIIKGIKKKKVRKQTIDVADEPVYEEISLARDDTRNVSDGSYVSARSVDSAFSERTPNTTSRSVSSLVYNEPDESVSGGVGSEELYNSYLPLNDVKYVDDDGDCDDVHTYVSDVSLWETDSDNSSLKKYVLSKESRCVTRPYTSQVPLEEVPYMVEAFQPLLELTLDVTEVVPHMPFIDAHEFMTGDDDRTKVKLLIERIRSCNEPGKWQAFLHALNQAEYEYIVSLLRGETEDDHSDNRILLKLFTPQIMDRIDPEEFIDHLFEKGVINGRDMEEVRCEKDRRGAIAASFMLLHKVPRRVSNWFAVFLDVLEKCGMDDLIPQLNIPEVTVSTQREQINKQLDEDKYYLTPTDDLDDTRTKQIKSQSNRRLNRPLPSTFSARAQASSSNRSLSARTQAWTNKYLPLPPVPVRPMIVQPPRRPKTEIELLKEEKESLQQMIDEKLLKRQYKREVKALKLQLEKLYSDDTDENVDEIEMVEDGSNAEIANDVSNGNVVVEDPTKEAISNEQLPDLQHINAMLTDMKQELKNDILAMRDHVTEALLKSVFGLRSTSASTEENVYALPGDTIIPDKVPLYNTYNKQTRGLLTPKSHIMYKHYSMDSAMFSDFSYV